MPGVLRAEAPVFQPILGAVAGASQLHDAEPKIHWTRSPASTTFSFSSELSDGTSPWVSPFQDVDSTQRPDCGSCDFSLLPECAFGKDSHFEGEEFRLDGLDELQNKVASLLKVHGVEEDTEETNDRLTRSPSPGCSGGDASGSSTDCESHLDATQLATTAEDVSSAKATTKGNASEQVAGSATLAMPTAPADKPLGGPPEEVAAGEKEAPLVCAAADGAVVATRRPQRGWATTASTKNCDDKSKSCNVTTTLLLRNLPKRCSCSKFVDRLEEIGFRGDVDFLYTPVNLKNKCHMGEVLLNFRSEEAAGRFTQTFHKANAKTVFPGFNGTKPAEVTAAPVQGLEANIRKLQRSGLLLSMLASQPEFLPRIFDKDGRPAPFPTKDGATSSPSKPSKDDEELPKEN